MEFDAWIEIANLKARELKATKIDYYMPTLWKNSRIVIHYEAEN